METSSGKPANGNEYSSLFKEAVRHIQETRNAFALQLNTTVLSTHWSLGKLLHDRKVEGGYGSAVIARLSADLRNRFPSLGLSPRNLWYMKRFYERYAGSSEKLQRGVAVLPWRKNLLLLEQNLDDDATLFYAAECFRRNWTKDLLLNAIKMDVYAAEKGRSLDNNFAETLPAPQTAYAAEVFRDTYDLGFLGVKGADENPSVGIILCAEKDHLDVEIALQDISKPIAVAEYQLALPKKALQEAVLQEIATPIEDKT